MRIESDGLAEVDDGVVIVLLFAPGQAAVAKDAADFRIESNRVAEVPDRLVDFTLVLPRKAAFDQGVGIAGSNWMVWLKSAMALSYSFFSRQAVPRFMYAPASRGASRITSLKSAMALS